MRTIGLVVLLLLSACVSGNDFDRVRGDLHEQQRSNYELRKEIETLKEKTTGVVKEDSLAALKESQADLFAKIDTTSGTLRELSGRLDEHRYFIEKSLKEYALEKDMLKMQIASLELQIKAIKDKLSAIEAESKPKEPTLGAAEAAATQAATTRPEGESQASAADPKTRSYDAAYQLFKDKKYRESREKFEAFIRDYPQTDLADNAQFWIAEAYFNEKDFESAILSYETLLKKYPDSDKVTGGLLKQGFAFIEIGDAKTGRIILNKLNEKYPNSREAEVARKKLAELDKRPAKKR